MDGMQRARRSVRGIRPARPNQRPNVGATTFEADGRTPKRHDSFEHGEALACSDLSYFAVAILLGESSPEAGPSLFRHFEDMLRWKALDGDDRLAVVAKSKIAVEPIFVMTIGPNEFPRRYEGSLDILAAITLDNLEGN
jgi:hypothetical protein